MSDSKHRNTAARKAPKTQAKSAVPDFDAVLRKLRAEKKPLLPKGFAGTIEDDLTGSGKYAITRRMALAFLERPWPEIAENVRADRKIAVAIANTAEAIRGSITSYELLLNWLRAAELRMLAAISTREDADRVMAQGKKDSVYAASPAGQKELADYIAKLKRDREVPRGYVTIKPLDGPREASNG